MARIKTFNDKQLERIDSNKLVGLEHLHDRNVGKKIINTGVIKPDHINLKDDTFKPKDEEEIIETNKVITEEDLNKEVEELKKEEKRYEDEFKSQYLKWAEEDEWSEYNWCDFDHKEYLVRLFKMDISSFKGYVTLNYSWSPILKNWKLSDQKMTEGILPIAKIIAIGKSIDSKKYSVGDIVLVPSCDIIGDDWNPKFLHVMQFQQSKGMQPVLPDGMEQRIPNVEKNWEHYKFVRPWVPKPTQVDNLTYLIPESKVKGRFSI